MSLRRIGNKFSFRPAATPRMTRAGSQRLSLLALECLRIAAADESGRFVVPSWSHVGDRLALRGWAIKVLPYTYQITDAGRAVLPSPSPASAAPAAGGLP